MGDAASWRRTFLTLLIGLGGCSERQMGIDLNVVSSSRAMEQVASLVHADSVHLLYGCDVLLELHVRGGREGDVATFESGQLDRADGPLRWNKSHADAMGTFFSFSSMPPERFEDLFGAAEVAFNDRRQAEVRFYGDSTDVFDVSYEFRFRMPDGSLYGVSQASRCER